MGGAGDAGGGGEGETRRRGAVAVGEAIEPDGARGTRQDRGEGGREGGEARRRRAEGRLLAAAAHRPIPRRLQRPSEEGDRVVEPEHLVAVLDIVLVEEGVELVGLVGVGEVDVAPLEARRKVVRLLAHQRYVRRVDRPHRRRVGRARVLGEARDWLGVPEGVALLGGALAALAPPLRRRQTLQHLLQRRRPLIAVSLLAVGRRHGCERRELWG